MYLPDGTEVAPVDMAVNDAPTRSLYAASLARTISCVSLFIFSSLWRVASHRAFASRYSGCFAQNKKTIACRVGWVVGGGTGKHIKVRNAETFTQGHNGELAHQSTVSKGNHGGGGVGIFVSCPCRRVQLALGDSTSVAVA